MIRALAICVVILSSALAAEGAQQGRVPRVGVLVWYASGSGPSERFVSAFREGLRELGYAEGQNITVLYRSADERADRVAVVADELVRSGVDVIVATPTPAAQAAKTATRSIPIVIAGVADAVAAGLVSKLARPGGNVTGTSLNLPELAGKRLELLREVIPQIGRVVLLVSERGPFVQETDVAARRLGIQVQTLLVNGPDQFAGAFAAARKQRASAVIVQPIFAQHFGAIASLAVRDGLASVSWIRSFAEAGGMMSYGPTLADIYRRVAYYVDRILKGAKPGDLPIEQPTKFELVINLKTARALGLQISRSLRLRADQLLE